MTSIKSRPTLLLLSLVAPQIAIALSIVWQCYNADGYFYAIPEKHLLAQEIESPKILLAGGSSVGWGSRSESFVSECGMPCVNLGINAGQGLNFRCNEAFEFANKGDVIVLSIEYYELSLKPSPLVLTRTLLASPSSFQYANWSEFRTVLDDGVFEVLARQVRAVSGDGEKSEHDKLYDRRHFNKFGDFIGHHGRTPDDQENWGLDLPSEAEIESALDRLQQFVERCRKNNIEVYYRLPSIPESLAREKMPQLESIAKRLKLIFAGRMLNELDETFLPDDSFFDTSYHLTESVKNDVSEVLAERLANQLRSR